MTSLQAFVVTVIGQVTVISVAAILLMTCSWRSAARRHAIGLLALVLVLSSPLLVLALPQTDVWRTRSQLEFAESQGDPMLIERESDLASINQSAAIDRTNPAVITRPVIESSSDDLSSNTRAAPPTKINPVDWLNWFLTLVAVTWIAGSVVSMSRWIWQTWQLRWIGRSLSSRSPAELASCEAVADEVRNVLRLRQLPPIAISDLVPSPIVLGMWQPTIVLPRDLLSTGTATRLRDVLIHECAHVVRRDPWVNAAQRLAAVLWWWHPGVLELNRWLARAREEVCDNFVLQHGDALNYAQTLLEFAEQYSARNRPLPVLGLLGSRWTLEERIAGLLKPERDTITRTKRRTVVLVAVLLGTLCWLVGGVKAVEEPAAVSEKVPTTKVVADGQRSDSPTDKLLDLLEDQNYGSEQFTDRWLLTLKQLVDLGPAAVPDLIKELDATRDDMMLRCLGFTLRAIGDKRAIPALIRAIPKTLLPPSSDMGLTTTDSELLKFAQRYDRVDLYRENFYSFGRPVNEIIGALNKLTGQKFDQVELWTLVGDGFPSQHRARELLFYRAAKQWADWWEKHWSDYVKDKTYSRVNLPATPGTKEAWQLLPGMKFTTTRYWPNHLLEPVLDTKTQRVFFDLDTGRYSNVPEKWRNASLETHLSDILTWAAGEGFDMMRAEYTSPQDNKRYYALQSIGLKAWQLGKQQWGPRTPVFTLEEVQAVGTPVDKWLMYYDRETKSFDPQATASFLYVTREGTPGVMFVGIEVKDTNVIFGVPHKGDYELDPVHLWKGRRFGWTGFEEAKPPIRREVEREAEPVKDEATTQPSRERLRGDSPTDKLLDLLEEQNAGSERFQDPWLQTLKQIVDLGPAAVPDLITELDATRDDMMLRCLGFTLRAIGDKRAIPSLIRAIPKTLQPPSSDMGLTANNSELLKFAQRHGGGPPMRNRHYSFGRPDNEIQWALHKLTGQKFNEVNLEGIGSSGFPSQQRAKEILFQRVARQWADWWDLHWSEYVTDKAYSRVDLIAANLTSDDWALTPGMVFKTDRYGSNYLLESVWDPQAKRVFYDFDTGRKGNLPEKWRNPEQIKTHLNDIIAWAAAEGYDIMGSEYSSPKDNQSYFALQPIGLRAWQLGKQRWTPPDTVFTLEEAQAAGTPVDNWLLFYNDQTKLIEPQSTAAFLYITREGTPGLMFVGIEVKDTNYKIGERFEGDNELNPVHLAKGRRYGWTEFREANPPIRNRK